MATTEENLSILKDSPGPMPAVPSVAAGADAATADPVPVAACEKLAEDAAQTTLMVVEFQRWYVRQSVQR